MTKWKLILRNITCCVNSSLVLGVVFFTDTCLIYMTDFIRHEIDKGNVVGMVLLDLQKAFDMLTTPFLLMKLQASGLGDDILRWFKSYLSERKQLVDVSGTYSSVLSITCGVPQSSILGPLLFLSMS